MKANEAPKEIYIFEDELQREDHVVKYGVNQDKGIEGLIEYTRTDAFIEKARKWFEEHFGNRLKWEITTYEFEDMQSMVEQFKNYIKGE